MVSTASVEKPSGSARRIATSPTARATWRISWARTASIAAMKNSITGASTAAAPTAPWRPLSPAAKPRRSPPDWLQARTVKPASQSRAARLATT